MHGVTIRDVARHAAVSVATVSRVINRTGGVSDDLSQRVNDAIAALGFEPDFLARSWRTRSAQTIAAVVSDNTSPHHGIALREAGAIALSHDYSLILCTSYFSAETERRYLNSLRLRRIDGILLNNVGDCHDEIHQLSEIGVPVVLLNRPLAHDATMVDAVVVDSYRGSFELVDHLIRLGHQRIAMIYWCLHEFHKSERLRGYRDALAAHGLPYCESLVRSACNNYQRGRRLSPELLDFSPRPTALYAAGYEIGLAAMTTLRSQGLRIPDDIAFAMFDDVPWGDLLDPPLTRVQNPAEELGRTAMRLLFERMADRQRPPQEIRLQPSLIVRRSCGWTGMATVAETAPMASSSAVDGRPGWSPAIPAARAEE